MNSISNVEQQLRDQRHQLSQRLMVLEQEHGSAALRAAEGDTDALKDVPAIMREIEGLQNQQGTLNAAWSALQARKEEAARLQTIAEIEESRAKLPELASETRERWIALQDALLAAGDAWRTFGEARAQMNKAASKCRQAANRHRGGTVISHDLDTATANNLLSGLLWRITKGEVDPRASAESNPEEVLRRLENTLESAVHHATNDAEYAFRHLQK